MARSSLVVTLIKILFQNNGNKVKVILRVLKLMISTFILELGEVKLAPQQDDKELHGNIGTLFLKFMTQVTKCHLHHLLMVFSNYVVFLPREGNVRFVK